MEQNNSFQKVLGRVERMAGKLWDQIRLVKDFSQAHQLHMAYEQALRLEEMAERLVLLTRVLPACTGSDMWIYVNTLDKKSRKIMLFF